MKTGFRRAYDARLALGLLLVLSMAANLVQAAGLSVHKSAGHQTLTSRRGRIFVLVLTHQAPVVGDPFNAVDCRFKPVL